MNPVQFESLYPEDSWEKEVGRLTRFAKEGKSCQLIGMPGVGRSVFIDLLTYNTAVRKKHFGQEQTSYHFVHVDFSEIRRRPLADVMKMLFLALADSLRDRKMLESYGAVNELLRGALQMQDELVMTEELKHAIETLVYEKKLNVIFLFDRFEDYVPMVTSQLFANLRVLRNRAKYHFSIVFSVNKPLEDLVEPLVLTDYFDLIAGNTVYLPLHDEKSVLFSLSYVEKLTEKKLEKAVFADILKLTAGHGKLTRLASEASLAKEEEVGDLMAFLLSQKTIRNGLSEIWLSLSPREQQYLLSEKKPDDESVKEYLEAIQLSKSGEITIPLLTTYLQNMAKEGMKEEQIIYEQDTNKIKKGSLTLSDDLTSAEFLMLRYLVLHPEEIVTRDDLIGVVWGDNRSTAGVTDQALDQLLFRLRKKIEENPNNPVHIQTVKGRGIKFAP